MTTLADQTSWIAFVVAAGAAMVAAVIDFRRFRVPNMLTLPLCISGLAFHAALHGLPGLRYGVGGMLMGLIVLFLFYVLGVMGAGDVKLLAGVGAWLGPASTVYVFCVAGMATGAHSLVALAWQRRLREIPAMFYVVFMQIMTLGRHLVGNSVREAVSRPDRRRYVMPFAVMIAIGVIVVAIRGG